MNDKSRVVKYADLRKKISNIDVYSFEESKDVGKNIPTPVNMNHKKATAEFTKITEKPETEVILQEKNLKASKSGIKKNTLSMSIDELIKEYDTYDSTSQKKDAKARYHKKVKEEKNASHKGPSLKAWIWVSIGLIIIALIVAIILIIIGVI